MAAKKIIAGVVVVGLLGVLVLGYMGFVPILSDLMGANKPRDLGVYPPEGTMDSVDEALGTTYHTLSQGNVGEDSLELTDFMEKSGELTSEEATALVNYHANHWKYYPLTDIQILIHDDGVAEVSGVLNIDRFTGYADAKNIPENKREIVRPYLGYFQTNPSFYMKGGLSITNGVADVDVQEVQVGKVTFTSDQIQDNVYYLEDFIEMIIPPFQIHSLYLDDGKILYDAYIPTSVGLSPP